jgi:hypothetical protein
LGHSISSLICINGWVIALSPSNIEHQQLLRINLEGALRVKLIVQRIKLML